LESLLQNTPILSYSKDGLTPLDLAKKEGDVSYFLSLAYFYKLNPKQLKKYSIKIAKLHQNL